MQETSCRDFCKLRNLENIEIFKDKKSGRRSNRPMYRRMIGLILSGKIQHVIAYKLDRLSRSCQDLLHFAELCKGSNCHISFSTQAEMDTSSAMGNLVFQIMGAFAEFESSMISERTKDGMAEKKRQGKKFGGDRKSVEFNSARIAIYLFRKKPWSLRKIREKLKLERNLFYKTVEWMENQSGGFVTDYTDERYDPTVRPFSYKRVDREGKYRNPEDPRLLLRQQKRHQQATKAVGEFFSRYKTDDELKSFVDKALSESSIARDLPSIEDFFND